MGALLCAVTQRPRLMRLHHIPHMASRGLSPFWSAVKDEKNGKVFVVIFNGLDLNGRHLAFTHILLVRNSHMITIKRNRG